MTSRRKRWETETDRLLFLQREDPIEFWLHRAHELAPRLALPVGFLQEGLGIVVGAVSEDWLRGRLAKGPEGMLRAFHGHPLAMALGTAGETSVVMVLELAVYLKRLQGIEGLQAVVPALRGDDTFAGTLLQLAYGYRFHKMGAGVCFEPPAASGRRGDIRLLWGGRDYMVECYVERADQDPLKEVVSFTLPRISYAAQDAEKVVRALIRFSAYPDTQQRLRLERVATILVRAVPPAGSVVATTDCAIIEIEDIAGQPDTDFADGRPSGPYASADIGMVLGRVEREVVMRPLHGGMTPVWQLSRAFCWRPPRQGETPGDRAAELYDRIASKLPQARAETGNAKRIVIAQVNEWRNSDAWNPAIASEIQRRLWSKHRDLVMVMLVSRRWTSDHRFRYVGSLLGVERDDLMAEVFEKIGAVDYTIDLLQDYK